MPGHVGSNNANRLISQIQVDNGNGVAVGPATGAVFVGNGYSGYAGGPVGSLGFVAMVDFSHYAIVGGTPPPTIPPTTAPPRTTTTRPAPTTSTTQPPSNTLCGVLDKAGGAALLPARRTSWKATDQRPPFTKSAPR